MARRRSAAIRREGEGSDTRTSLGAPVWIDHSASAGLDAAEALPAAYRHAFEAVDRAQFIPGRTWVGGDEDRDDTAVDRGIDPKAWDKAVYDATLPIVTQFDEGTVTWPEQGRRPTSSG